MPLVSPALDQHVRARAAHRCEYCRLPQSAVRLTFPVDHVIARQHRGLDVPDNLALACTRCNSKKGPNIATLDPADAGLIRLFHPRQDGWGDHFAWRGAAIIGTSAIGRGTAALLDVNEAFQVALRQRLFDAGRLPP